MEQEHFFTGYCRLLDAGRTVCAVTEAGKLTETDCCYPDCVHAPACPIAGSIRQLSDADA